MIIVTMHIGLHGIGMHSMMHRGLATIVHMVVLRALVLMLLPLIGWGKVISTAASMSGRRRRVFVSVLLVVRESLEIKNFSSLLFVSLDVVESRAMDRALLMSRSPYLVSPTIG